MENAAKGPRLFRKGRIRREDPGMKRIGIAGCGPSVGTTHFSILTASYLSGVLRRRTAVLECNGSGDFLKFSRIFGKEAKMLPKAVTDGSCHSFKIWETDYFAGAGREALREIAGESYEAVVMDFGAYERQLREELLLCDRRFLVCSGREWQLPGLADMLEEEKVRRDGWEYFLSFEGDEPAEVLGRNFGISLRRIPMTGSPFCITGELFSFFEKFLN